MVLGKNSLSSVSKDNVCYLLLVICYLKTISIRLKIFNQKQATNNQQNLFNAPAVYRMAGFVLISVPDAL